MKKRICYFDNLKFILILLVVIGHFLSSFKTDHLYASIYSFIYIFHMPCFIFLAGYFSKGLIKEGKLSVNKIIGYSILYFIMQTGLLILLGKNFTLIVPSLALWYLQSMIIWILLLPVIDKFKPKYCILFSFVFAVLIGFDKNAGVILSIARTVSFLPYFLLGYYIKKEQIFKFFNKKNYIIAFLIIIVSACCLYISNINYSFLNSFSYGKFSYSALDLEYIGVIYKILSYFLGIVIGFSFMLLIPKTKQIFTKLGERTLQVFLLHIPFVYAFRGYDLNQYFNTPFEMFLLFLAIILFVFILSLKIFSYPFDFIMSLKYTRFLKQNK